MSGLPQFEFGDVKFITESLSYKLAFGVWKTRVFTQKDAVGWIMGNAGSSVFGEQPIGTKIIVINILIKTQATVKW